MELLLELLELLLVFRGFVATVPSGVSFFNSLRESDLLAGSGTGSRSPILASGGQFQQFGLAQFVLSD